MQMWATKRRKEESEKGLRRKALAICRMYHSSRKRWGLSACILWLHITSLPLAWCRPCCLFVCVHVCYGQCWPQTWAALADIMRGAGLLWLGQALPLSLSLTHSHTCTHTHTRLYPPNLHKLGDTHIAPLESCWENMKMEKEWLFLDSLCHS